MLTPWKEDEKGPYYCPDCGVVEGFFHYSPDIKEQIKIVHVDFKKPRAQVIGLLGEENQSCPVLVFDTSDTAPEQAKKSMTTGKAFIDDAMEICKFLAASYGGVIPH